MDNKEDGSYYVFDVVRGVLDKKSIRKSSDKTSSSAEFWLSMDSEKQVKTSNFLENLLMQLPKDRENEYRFQSMNLTAFDFAT